MTIENEQYFRNSVLISKQKNNYELTLKDDGTTYFLVARNPENETGLGSIMRIIFILIIVLVPGVQFFIPDHYYNKFSKNRNSKCAS